MVAEWIGVLNLKTAMLITREVPDLLYVAGTDNGGFFILRMKYIHSFSIRNVLTKSGKRNIFKEINTAK